MQWIAVLGRVEDKIVECFRHGGGVPYEAYPRFHEVMAEESGQTVLPALLEHILPLVPDLTQRLADGIDVLDLGCGSGRALMAETFPNSRFIGCDLSEEAIGAARKAASARGLANLRFATQDAATMGESEAYDLIAGRGRLREGRGQAAAPRLPERLLRDAQIAAGGARLPEAGRSYRRPRKLRKRRNGCEARHSRRFGALVSLNGVGLS
jgi:SAM-dependent methyltransferase